MARNGVFIHADRLTEARELRGMTITDLAREVGVTRQTISAIENGTTQPSVGVLRVISDILRFPDWHFTMEEEILPPINATVFYRSMKKTLSSKRLQTKRWLRLITRQYALYSDYIEFPETNLKRFEGDYESLTDDDVDELAEKTRRYWNLGDGPISNLTLLLENNGIIISHIDLGTPDLDACSTTWGGRCFILVNSVKTTCSRTLANLAHELGHLVLHSGVSADVLQSNIDVIEKQAWRFASSFLLPAKTFFGETFEASLAVFERLKKRWRVSMAMMIMRCADGGVIDEYRKNYLFTEMSRKGYRRKEPLDDVLPVETPQLFLDADKLLVSSGTCERDWLTHHVALDIVDYCAIIGAQPSYIQPIQRKPILRIV